MPPPLLIEPCRTRGEWRVFERVPEILHGGDPCFIPPLPGQVMKLRSAEHPFHRDGSLTAYVARRGGRVVGRIASIDNRTHNERHGERTGFFGFFDFNSPETARELLERACEDARLSGFDSVRGPFGPTQNDECGLQVDAFKEKPYVGMPFNPESYVTTYGDLGLKGLRDFLAYYLDPALAGAFQGRVGALAEKIRTRLPITVRPVDMARMQEEAALVARLFNESLEDEWGFMPLSHETALAWARDLLGHVDPEAILIAEVEGEPVGLSISLPDVNEHLGRAASLPRWLRWPYLIWALKMRRCRRARWAVFGLLPEYRRRGGTVLLMYETVMRVKAMYGSGELSWTQETNDEVNRLAQQLGLQPYKRYRIYEMAL